MLSVRYTFSPLFSVSHACRVTKCKHVTNIVLFHFMFVAVCLLEDGKGFSDSCRISRGESEKASRYHPQFVRLAST